MNLSPRELPGCLAGTRFLEQHRVGEHARPVVKGLFRGRGALGAAVRTSAPVWTPDMGLEGHAHDGVELQSLNVRGSVLSLGGREPRKVAAALLRSPLRVGENLDPRHAQGRQDVTDVVAQSAREDHKERSRRRQ